MPTARGKVKSEEHVYRGYLASKQIPLPLPLTMYIFQTPLSGFALLD